MNPRLLALPVALAALATTALASGESTSISFTNVLVQGTPAVAEPSIEVDPRNTDVVYVAGPSSNNSRVWRSLDGGLTWEERFSTLGTSGDTDIAVDDDGMVYASDLFPRVPVSFSDNGAATFHRVVRVGTDAGSYDRQWTDAAGQGRVIQTVADATLGGYVAWMSDDQARTFDGPHPVVSGQSLAGPPIFAPDGTIWTAHTTASAVGIARSSDGRSWTNRRVSPYTSSLTDGSLQSTFLFPVVAIDDVGNAYVVWSSVVPHGPPGGGEVAAVWVSASTDDGYTWSPAQMISDGVHSAILPWIVAGADGRVAVSWYQASDGIPSNFGTALTTWDVMFAQTLDATAETPSWTTAVVAPLVHTGAVCTQGTGCGVGAGNIPRPLDRRALDFFEMTIDAQGHALIAYNRDRERNPAVPGSITSGAPELMVARQTSGPTLR